MTWRSWSVRRSMGWVWRSCRRTAPRRTSRMGNSCVCSRIGARRSLASSSTIPVSGSYQRLSRRSSRPCVSSCTLSRSTIYFGEVPAGRKPVRRALPHGSWRVRYRYGGVKSGRGSRASSNASVAASIGLPSTVPHSVSDLPAKSVWVLLQTLGCRARAPPCPRRLGQVHSQLTVGSARRHNERQGMGLKVRGGGRDEPCPRVRKSGADRGALDVAGWRVLGERRSANGGCPHRVGDLRFGEGDGGRGVEDHGLR